VIVHGAYRYRLDLTVEQAERARRYAGCVRAVYNAALEQRRLAWSLGRRRVSRFAQDAELKALKRAKDLEWLAEAPHHCLQQALSDLERAYWNFFAGRAGHPTPRRKFVHDAFRYPDPSPTQIGLDRARQGWVRLPKLGWCRLRLSRPRTIEGRLLSATVSREGEHWYVSLACEIERHDPVTPSGAPVGLDLGVVNSVATSDGELLNLRVSTAREWEKLAILQARAARTCKGSANRRRPTRRSRA